MKDNKNDAEDFLGKNHSGKPKTFQDSKAPCKKRPDDYGVGYILRGDCL